MGAENYRSHKGPAFFVIDNKTGHVTPHTDAASWLEALSDPWWKKPWLYARWGWLTLIDRLCHRRTDIGRDGE